MNVKLVMVGDEDTGVEVPISTPSFFIGRDDKCDLHPKSHLVGGVHCMIAVGNNSITLEDCGGAVGTFVNGKKVQQRCELKNNDRVKIATLEFEVRLTSGDAVQKNRKPDYSRDAMLLGSAAFQNAFPGASAASGSTTHSTQDQRAKKKPPSKTDSEQAARKAEWDGVDLLILMAVGPLAVIALALLFPVESWKELYSVKQMWWWLRTQGWQMQWIRWGAPAILVIVLGILLFIRTRKESARSKRE